MITESKRDLKKVFNSSKEDIKSVKVYLKGQELIIPIYEDAETACSTCGGSCGNNCSQNCQYSKRG